MKIKYAGFENKVSALKLGIRRGTIMRKISQGILSVCLAVTIYSVSLPRAFAAVPGFINFQGRLLDANKLPRNGSFTMTFKICDTLAGDCSSPLWTEVKNVSVTNGVFAVQLGSTTALTSGVFSAAARYLEITVGAETLAPREQLAAGPYSFMASVADALTGNDGSALLNISSVALAGFYSAPGVRSNLGLAIGADVQAYNANLTTLAGLDGSGLTGVITSTGVILSSLNAVILSTQSLALATDTNAINTLVKRDASGNFTAGMIPADVTGAVTGTASLATALAADPADCAALSYASGINASGAAQCAALPIVSTAALVAADTTNTDNISMVITMSTSVNTGNTLVKRDGSGNFTAGAITATSFAGNVTVADSGLVDLSAINNSSTAEGLKLPQAADVSAGTAEGQVAWDSDGDLLQVGTGAGIKTMGIPNNITVYDTTVGSPFTWVRPPGVSTVYVQVWGGGGSGGAGATNQSGGGGGGGGYSAGLVAVSGNASVVVGGVAGTSSFTGGTTLTANGGASAVGVTLGTGGTATGGTINISGGPGATAGGTMPGGGGGGSPMGGAGGPGGAGAASGDIAGAAGTAPGGGGGGGHEDSGTAGAGAIGMVIVMY